MFNFQALKAALNSGTVAPKVSPEDAGNTDFLEAAAGVAALTAHSDGDISKDERAKTVNLLTGHGKLGTLFQRHEIEACIDKMLRRAETSTGRNEIARELDDLKKHPKGSQWAEDAYLIGVDVAMADGTISDKEAEMLTKIAGRLGVDLGKFEF